MMPSKNSRGRGASRKRARTMPQDARDGVAATHGSWPAAKIRHLQSVMPGRTRHPAAASLPQVSEARNPHKGWIRFRGPVSTL